MKRHLRRGLFLLIVLALVLPMGGLLSAQDEKVVTVGLSSEPANLDPRHYELTPSTFAVVWQIYEPLFYHDTRTDELTPGLAESWEQIDEDSYQFNLRQDVSWHDGEPFTADDVVWTMSRIPFQVSQYDLDPETPVEKVDDYTVIINTNGPIGYFLRQTMALNVRILPEHIMEPYYAETRAMTFEPTTDEDGNEVTAEDQMEDALYALERGDTWTEPAYVGTGPFKFNNWERGVEIVLDANDDYWGGRPNVDQLIFRWVEEDTSRLIGLEAGDFDIILDFPDQEVSRLEEAPNIGVIVSPGLGYHMLTINTVTPALSDVRVRQAIAYALDKEAILDLYPGIVSRTCGPLSAISGFYNDAVNCYDYNPDMARQLLEEAGWDSSQTITLKTVPTMTDEALVIQQYLADVGINVEVQEVEAGVYYSQVRTGESELALYSFSNIVDPDHIYWVFHTDWLGGGIFGYDNETVNTLTVEGKSETDQEARVAMYNEVQDTIVNDAVAVFLYSADTLRAYRTDRITGLEEMPNPTDVFYWLRSVDVIQ